MLWTTHKPQTFTYDFIQDAPAEHIIASMVAIIMSYGFPLTLPFIQRFGRSSVKLTFLVSVATSIAMMVVFAYRDPFDATHPKRLYILHSENVRSCQFH